MAKYTGNPSEKGRQEMFGKKKPIRVMHYEGIVGFPTDYPCIIELTDTTLIIKNRMNPVTTVSLPRERIFSMSLLGEDRFMQQFKGSNQIINQQIAKYYFVIQYDNGTLVFWTTGFKEYKRLGDLQRNTLNTLNKIEL